MHLRKAFVEDVLASRWSSVQLRSDLPQCFFHVGEPFFRFALVPHNIPCLLHSVPFAYRVRPMGKVV